MANACESLDDVSIHLIQINQSEEINIAELEMLARKSVRRKERNNGDNNTYGTERSLTILANILQLKKVSDNDEEAKELLERALTSRIKSQGVATDSE